MDTKYNSAATVVHVPVNLPNKYSSLLDKIKTEIDKYHLNEGDDYKEPKAPKNSHHFIKYGDGPERQIRNFYRQFADEIIKATGSIDKQYKTNNKFEACALTLIKSYLDLHSKKTRGKAHDSLMLNQQIFRNAGLLSDRVNNLFLHID